MTKASTASSRKNSRLRRPTSPRASRDGSSSLPSVEVLLATTAKLLSQTSVLDRSYSKLSTLSNPTTIGSQDLENKFGHGQDGQEGRPGATVHRAAGEELESEAGASRGGSPLIRAGRPNHFPPASQQSADPAAFDMSRPGSRHTREEVHKQLKELKSEIGAFSAAISTPASARAMGTRIPVPKPYMSMHAGSAKPAHELVNEPASGATGASIGKDEGAAIVEARKTTVVAEIQASSSQDAAEAAVTAYTAQSLSVRGPTGGPNTVSALFDTLWDTDDDSLLSANTSARAGLPGAEGSGPARKASDGVGSSLDQVWSKIAKAAGALGPISASPSMFSSEASGPGVEPQVPRPRKGTHKKSVESGTLDRKMRGLEAAWQQLEKSQSNRSSSHGQGSLICSATTASNSHAAIPPLQLARLHAHGGQEPLAPEAPESSEIQSGADELQSIKPPNAESRPQVNLDSKSEATAVPCADVVGPAEAAAPASTAKIPSPPPAEVDEKPIRPTVVIPEAVPPSTAPATGVAMDKDKRRDESPVAGDNATRATHAVEESPSPTRSPPLTVRLPLPDPKPRRKLHLNFWRTKEPQRRKADANRPAPAESQVRAPETSPVQPRPQRSSSSSPDKPQRSKDSFNRLTSMFWRRNSLPSKTPSDAALPAPAAAAPAPPPVAPKPAPVAAHARSEHRAPDSAAAKGGRAPEGRVEAARPVVKAAEPSHEASVASKRVEEVPLEAVPAIKKERRRMHAPNREDSAQGWVSNDEAVKQLLVPTWVPSTLGLPSPILDGQAEGATGICKTRPPMDESSIQKTCAPDQEVAHACLTEGVAAAAQADQGASSGPVRRSDSYGASGFEGAQGDDVDWLSPEKAVKNLLVPSWVPNKLPFSSIPIGDEAQVESSPTLSDSQPGLIAAVSPRQTVSRAPPDWSGTKVPFSEVPFPAPEYMLPLSAHRSLSSRPATVPEDDTFQGQASAETILPEPSLPDVPGDTEIPISEPAPPARIASRLAPASTLPSAVEPAPAAVARRVHTANSLPARHAARPKPGPAREQKPTPQKPKDGFFRSLFRRKSESGEKQRPAAEVAPVVSKARRSASETGSLPAIRTGRPPVVLPPPEKAERVRSPVSRAEGGKAAEAQVVLQPSAAEPKTQLENALDSNPQPEALEAKREQVAAQDPGQGQGSPEAGSRPVETRASWEAEFSFHIPVNSGQQQSSLDSSRALSTGRRRVTDEALDNLQRCFKDLETTYDKLPARAPSRERQRSTHAGTRTSKLPQMEFFERAAGNVKPRPWSATGTTEAVPFIMRKLPSPAANEAGLTRDLGAPEGSSYEPAALTTARWSKSLRRVDAREAESSRRIHGPTHRDGSPDSSPTKGKRATTATEQAGSTPNSARAVSPFGRVKCEPERAVPFLRVTGDEEQQSEGADTPVTRIEKQLKHSAGAEEGSESPQWRMIAERVVKGTEPVKAAASRGGNPAEREPHTHAGMTQHTMLHGSESSTSRPPVEPVIVDSNRPAFPALKAYLGAKSPPRTAHRDLSDDPEIAACRGVSALQRRFEGGLLVASNVAALERQYDEQRHLRDRTAAWASEQAVKVSRSPGRETQPSIALTASGQAAALESARQRVLWGSEPPSSSRSTRSARPGNALH